MKQINIAAHYEHYDDGYVDLSKHVRKCFSELDIIEMGKEIGKVYDEVIEEVMDLIVINLKQ